MRHDIYTMPTIPFVAGQSKTLQWRLLTESRRPFNAEGCIGNFAVVDYSDKTSDPIISKPLTFRIGDDVTKFKSIASVDLTPNDTIGLFGKYIYQIIIRDVDGEAEIPNQGFLLISHNINEGFLR